MPSDTPNLDESETVILSRVSRARAEHTTIESPMTSIEMRAAYRIQDLRTKSAERVGYKLGLVSEAKQQQMGVSAPIHGVVEQRMLLEDGFAISDFIQPRMEPELVAVLGREIPADASPGAARAAVAGQFVAVDVLDCVWADYRFVASDVVVDNVSAGGFLMDETFVNPPSEGELAMFLNGDLVSRGRIGSLGDLGERLAWLAAEVVGLRAGEVVFMASPARAVEIRPGSLEVRGPAGAVLCAEIDS